MSAFRSYLHELIQSLPPQPIPRDALENAVTSALAKSEGHSSPENRKASWEFVLKDDIFTLAATEGRALKGSSTTYYDDLRDRLDIILTLTEHEACEQVFPFNVLYDLLETQTIQSCSHIFSWIEARSDRLTKDMIPQKGKALILLRTLNDLLKRLSKMGETTKFCGRILTFLSSVFPLGERSGVNLRGEFGPVWDGPGLSQYEKVVKEVVEKKPVQEQEMEEDKMQVDEQKNTEGATSDPALSQVKDGSEDFYQTFWSLQLPFSRPPSFSEHHTLPQFKEAVNRVLPIIKEATAKERALMGSKTSSGSASLKRKREPEAVTALGTEYFFAKYLTSPDLLDLEIADTHFRRQFLFQLLVLLHHLLSFTKTAKAEWATPRNRSLQMDFTLEAADAQWVTETMTRAYEELRQTSPNGRAFAETVSVILDREKNWIKWKNELCSPFDKEPWSAEVDVVTEDGSLVKRKVGLEEATKEARLKMCEDPPEWEHAYGTGPLTEIWEMGYRDPMDLQRHIQPGDVKDFVKKVKQEDARIEMRRKQLVKKAEQLAAARAKAAAAAAALQPKESKEAPAPIKPVPSSAPQDTLTASTPPTAPRAMPATPPLHHPLPAKPGTTPIKPVEASSPAPAPPTPAPTTPTPPVTASTSAPAPAPVPAPTPAPEPAPIVLPRDEQIIRAEESKQRWSWLALRTARDQYLQQFGKIGTGDIILLVQEIEKAAKEAKEQEEKEKEREEKAKAINESELVVTQEDSAAMSPMPTQPSASDASLRTDESAVSLLNGQDAEGDVKMEP